MLWESGAPSIGRKGVREIALATTAFGNWSLNDRNVVVSGKAGCGGERRKAAISSVAVLMAAVANFADVPGREIARRNQPFVHLPRPRPDRLESRPWIGGLKGALVGELRRAAFGQGKRKPDVRFMA